MAGGAGRQSGKRRWLLAAALALVVWIAAGFLLRALSSGEILRGTTASGVDLGGQTREEAAGLLADIDPPAVDVSSAERSFTVEAPEAGLEVDAGATAERAYSSGREGVGAVLMGPLFLVTDRSVEPVYEDVETKALSKTVDRIADRVDQAPFVGALTVDPKTLAVDAKQPEPGTRVEREKAGAAIVEALRSGDESIDLPVEKVPAPSEAEVAAVADEAESYLESPLEVRTAGGPTQFSRKRMAEVLAIESSGSGIRLGADPKATAELIADLAKKRDIAAQDAQLDTPSSPPVTLSEQGDLSWRPKPGVASVDADRDGRRIRQERAVDAVAEAVRRGEHQAKFETDDVEPDVTKDSLDNATSLIGTFTTSFTCCEPRVTNIQRIAETVDGTVIGAGEQFSLNGIAGERTRANGYVPAPTIGEDNELIDTVGGGVSQFSTTTYNAAYFAGLQIDSHTPHSFYISRYPPGRESTLNFGSIDLLWTNDTDAPVVVRSSASDTSVTVSIYGGNSGRRVRSETQSRSDNSEGGFDITVDRVIVYGDGERKREPYTTSYGTPSE